MYELESYLLVNLLRQGPRLMKKEFKISYSVGYLIVCP